MTCRSIAPCAVCEGCRAIAAMPPWTPAPLEYPAGANRQCLGCGLNIHHAGDIPGHWRAAFHVPCAGHAGGVHRPRP